MKNQMQGVEGLDSEVIEAILLLLEQGISMRADGSAWRNGVMICDPYNGLAVGEEE